MFAPTVEIGTGTRSVSRLSTEGFAETVPADPTDDLRLVPKVRC
jgi:hypothetical protein